MKRQDAIDSLRACAADLKARGVEALYLFGSTARDEAGEGSDVDVFLDYDPKSKFSLFTLVNVKHLLEDHLSVEVDVTTRNSLHPRLRDDIEASAVRVF